MDILLITLGVVLLVLNIITILFLLRNKQQKTEDPAQTFKNEFNSFKDSFSQSFGHMSKDIAKDMTGALTRVDEKVGVFNKQVESLNKSQDNFSRILAGVKQYGVLAEFSLASLLKDLLPATQFIEICKK
jgi:RmuC family.